MTGIRTVGVPNEIKTDEHRVAITPDGVRELERHGVDVLVETGAGDGAELPRRRLRGRRRRRSSPTAADVWARSMVVKVKEPQAEEFAFLRADLMLFTYLHLAAYPEVAEALLGRRHHRHRLRDRAAPTAARSRCWRR